MKIVTAPDEACNQHALIPTLMDFSQRPDCGAAIDCDDDNAAVYPGAEEVCGNNIDEDCNGVDLTGTDTDGDGYNAEAGCGTPQDCNDGRQHNSPGCNRDMR